MKKTVIEKITKTETVKYDIDEIEQILISQAGLSVHHATVEWNSGESFPNSCTITETTETESES